MEAGTNEGTETLALDQIQGNLAGFNKPLQSFIALHFNDAAEGRNFVHAVLREVDTCAAVAAFNRRYKWHLKHKKPPPTSEWFNLLFSAKGLEAIDAPELEQFEAVFREGMRARAGALGDTGKSDPIGWIEPFQAEIHAVVILAADTPEGLTHWQERVGNHAHAHQVSVLERIDGRVREGEARGHEHFGFKDGVSQPGIVGLSEEPPKPGQQLLPAGEFILGLPRLGEAEAPRPVGYEPAPPPPRPPFPAWAVNGSYAVLRQLRQDVGAFHAFLSENASATGGNEDLLGAKLIGRYQSGAPLEMTRAEAEAHAGEQFVPPDEDARADEAVANDFGYLPQDPGGDLVPRGAHIRKVFPRDEDPPRQPEAERHRILRRGIPFGPDFPEGGGGYGETAPSSDEDRGLIFLCYQGSIEEQFEVVQRRWANNAEGPFPQEGDSQDPIISQDESAPTFNLPPDHAGEALLAVKRWVFTIGGEYLFAPSVNGLKVLAGR